MTKIYTHTTLIEYDTNFRDTNLFTNFIQELLLTKDNLSLSFEIIAYSNAFINCRFKLTTKEQQEFVINLVDKYIKEYN